MHVREHTVAAPLDWASPDGEQLNLFVRGLVDPDKHHLSLPLLVYLQGGPGGACPRPVERSGWIEEALADYRVVLVDQRGTGGSSAIDGSDLEHVRQTVYDGQQWTTLAQSYGGWITLSYLSYAPEALLTCFVTGGIPGVGVSASEVYRRTFGRVAAKTRAYYDRYPHDVSVVSAIADRLADDDVRLPDGDRLTVHRFQSLGVDFGSKRGFERMHWLVESAFTGRGAFSDAFLADCLARTSSASNPLYWTLQEAIYADAGSGATAWAAQAERDRRPEFGPSKRPLLFTGEMAFPWMFDEVRLLRPFRDAVHVLAQRSRWPSLYDPERLAANEVPLVAAVYYDDMHVDARLQLDTLAGVGASQAWITNEHEHDGIASGTVLTRLRHVLRDGGGRQLPR